MSTTGYINLCVATEVSSEKPNGLTQFFATAPSDGYPTMILGLLVDYYQNGNGNINHLKQSYEKIYAHLPEHYQYKLDVEEFNEVIEDSTDYQYWGYDYIIDLDGNLTVLKDGKPFNPIDYANELYEDAGILARQEIQQHLEALSHLGIHLVNK
ncbi:hypothetical protein [Aeromonas sp. MrichA-1]|uniref:hypothetical protein n=1 Tax=Aeromonas sp. MrichA-1 TaxID=2823362 RepID=UPI001B32F4F1|nr:hypothetical protein [Aeromonas sp. MrichA-1]MBP4081934.1 hypothetical protein [Aeromonas sp. MrichA-1]